MTARSEVPPPVVGGPGVGMVDRVAQRMESCVHFTGTVHEACQAGVRYEDVKLDHPPIAYTRRGRTYTATRSLPCLGSKYNHGGAVCGKRCTPTREQVEAELAAQDAEIAQMGEARRRIIAVQGGKRGGSGTVECPRCGGSLRYSQAASNGHVHAVCATGGCLGWME